MSRIKRMPLREVKINSIIRWDGLWGVVCSGHGDKRKIDFWEIPAELVSAYETVEVLIPAGGKK